MVFLQFFCAYILICYKIELIENYQEYRNLVTDKINKQLSEIVCCVTPCVSRLYRMAWSGGASALHFKQLLLSQLAYQTPIADDLLHLLMWQKKYLLYLSFTALFYVLYLINVKFLFDAVWAYLFICMKVGRNCIKWYKLSTYRTIF